MLLFTYKPQENKEKDTTDHEGSEEIRQEQQYSQRYVYHHFLSQFFVRLVGFLHCYFAIFPKVCVSSFLVTVFVRFVGFYIAILQP